MRTFLALMLTAIVSCTAVSCTGEKEAPTAKASASAAEDPAAQLGPFCENVCKKSTTCGIEAAEKLAKGHANELALIERLRKDAPKTEESCASACKASTVTGEEGAVLARAKSCLDQTSCETFDRCLESAEKSQGGS